MSYDLIYNSNKINSLRIVYDTERLKYVRPPISRSNVFKGLEGAQCRLIKVSIHFKVSTGLTVVSKLSKTKSVGPIDD